MIPKYKKFITEKMVEISRQKIVLDIGGGDRFQKWLGEYQNLFKDCDYKTMDYDNNLGADVIGDIHNIPMRNESVDAIICSSVLEHVENPIQAVTEMKRILKPGGKIFVYVPSIYPYHARKGSYPDYWRFFDDTLSFLFKDFSFMEIAKVGGYFKALFFFIPLQHKIRFVIDPLARCLDSFFKTEKRTTTSGYCLFAIK
ncbi:MAG: class I SAM-dependent methyltransferase [Candidatus Vogelbacteria bacterium]